MLSNWFARCRAFVCVVSLGLLLGACATPPRIASSGAEPAFDRLGRFALSVNHSNGKQDAVQGSFAWHDNGRELTLDLANPLGSTLARVNVIDGHAQLTRTNGTVEQAESPDALVELVLGSPIPVGGLRSWLQGQTGPAPALKVEKDDQGHVARFEQGGWRVALTRYDAQGPTLLQLNRNEGSRTVSVRLAIDSQ